MKIVKICLRKFIVDINKSPKLVNGDIGVGRYIIWYINICLMNLFSS